MVYPGHKFGIPYYTTVLMFPSRFHKLFIFLIIKDFEREFFKNTTYSLDHLAFLKVVFKSQKFLAQVQSSSILQYMVLKCLNHGNWK